ncbi:hypothetical protein ABFX02_13G045100 [Erythranthe guttata]
MCSMIFNLFTSAMTIDLANTSFSGADSLVGLSTDLIYFELMHSIFLSGIGPIIRAVGLGFLRLIPKKSSCLLPSVASAMVRRLRWWPPLFQAAPGYAYFLGFSIFLSCTSK